MTELPQGFNLPYRYYDRDDMCWRSDIIDYVAAPITQEAIEQRRRKHVENGDSPGELPVDHHPAGDGRTGGGSK